MATARLVAPVLPAISTDPINRFIRSLCSLDADVVVEQLCDDARLWLASNLYASGRARIRKALIRALSSLTVLQCEPAVVWTKDCIGVVEADITCERSDDSRAAFPLTVVLYFRGSLISDIRLSTYDSGLVASFLTPRRHC
jgi:hypothetical protein